jgi:hypothetical protein
MPRVEPQSAHDQEVQALFAQHAPDVEITAVSKQISPKVLPDTEERVDAYYCFVDLGEGQDVDSVIEMLNGKEGSWGGAVRVSRARNPDRKMLKVQGTNSGGGGGGRREFGDSPWRRGGSNAQE